MYVEVTSFDFLPPFLVCPKGFKPPILGDFEPPQHWGLGGDLARFDHLGTR